MRFTDVRKFDSRFSCLQQAHIRVAPGSTQVGWGGYRSKTMRGDADCGRGWRWLSASFRLIGSTAYSSMEIENHPAT
jgi:hypothetical protein